MSAISDLTAVKTREPADRQKEPVNAQGLQKAAQVINNAPLQNPSKLLERDFVVMLPESDPLVAQARAATAQNINALNSLGETLLHTAVRRGDSEAVRILLIKWADITIPNKQGDTPLTLAAMEGHREIALQLISAQQTKARAFKHPRRDNFGAFKLFDVLIESTLDPDSYSTPYLRYLKTKEMITDYVSSKDIATLTLTSLLRTHLSRSPHDNSPDGTLPLDALIGIAMYASTNDDRALSMMRFLLNRGAKFHEYARCPDGTIVKTDVFAERRYLPKTAAFLREELARENSKPREEDNTYMP
jgi:hypothetical protein